MWADLTGYSKMRSTTAACGVPVVLGKLWSDIPARQTSSASVTSGGLPGPDRPVPSEGMMRSVSSTWSAVRRVSRSAIREGPRVRRV